MSIARRKGERHWLADAFGLAIRQFTSEREFDYQTPAERVRIDCDLFPLRGH